MTAPPLPASPCVRVKLDYSTAAGTDMGSRFYLSYSGSAPSAANCVTLATDIATSWASRLAGSVYELITLSEVDVLDIATDSGASGTVSVSHAGTLGGGALTANACTNIEYQIARRYRGGKPRMYLPPPDDSAILSIDKWTTGFVSSVTTAITDFFADIEGFTVGSMGVLEHVNLSYYKGFVNVENSSGRERAAPTYRDSALLDPVTGYVVKQVVGSQRRRRTATTY